MDRAKLIVEVNAILMQAFARKDNDDRVGEERVADWIIEKFPNWIMEEIFIVKVQLSIHAVNHGVRQALIYNEDRSIEWTGDAPQEVIDVCEGEPKTFWYAHLDKNNQVTLDFPAFTEVDW